MKIALGQINNTVGDLKGNLNLMVRFARDAAGHGANLVVFPELSLNGYPPRDLVEKPGFLRRTEECLQQLAHETADLDLTLICGYVGHSPKDTGKTAANCAAVIEKGEIIFRQTKMLLPTYDVFDEARNFAPAETQEICTIRGVPVALAICEDAWNDKQFWERPMYREDPVEALMAKGAQLLVVINGSPYNMGKRALRRSIFQELARHYSAPVVYVNMVGGNDQLVFDGSSFAVGRDGSIIAAAPSFEEALVLADTGAGAGEIRESLPDQHEAVYQALVLGTRDYLRKCGFERVLLGLSGGIDSSLTAVIAVDAVGKENVVGVAMPGPYSSDHALDDARSLAANLGIRFEVVSIADAWQQMVESLNRVFGGAPPDVTEENLQARLRGMTLMALSNKWNALVLTTGNKSELAVGYCTLYGDMCGGLAAISDVPKTMVYEIARVANRRHPDAIPENVFVKPPSAELRPDQKDSDSLPDYGVLDRILRAYVEEYRTPQEIAESLSLPIELVRDIANKVDRNEYKRQQAAPGLKITTKAFGMGRRFPIAQRFYE